MASLSYFQMSVLTPPQQTDLTTACTVMDDWGISEEDMPFIRRAITRCSAAASDFCNRQFGIAQYKIVARLERGYRDGHLTLGDTSPIMLPVWPIASFVSVIETDEDGTDTTLVEGTDYEAIYNVGKLFRLDSFGRQRDWWPRKKVTITCWSGYVLPGDSTYYPGAQKLPAHLEDAIGRMAATRYFERSRDPFVKSEIVEGIGRTDYIVSPNLTSDGGNMSPDVLDILNNFRQPVLA